MRVHDYYAPTAYDSSKPRELPSHTPSEKLTPTARALRGKERALSWGIYFGDFRNTNSRRDVRELKEDGQALATHISADRVKVTTSHNPKAVWMMVRGVAGLICAVLILINTIMVFDWGVEEYLHFYYRSPLSFWISCAPVALLLVGSIAIPLVDDKNNIFLDRRTGMITLPKHFSGKEEEIPFSHFDAYLRMDFDGKVASPYWKVHIGHRTSSRGFDIFDRFHRPAHAFQAWELVQQFMDISKPLPDVAVYEVVRDLDPVTAEYDRRTGRPPNYWRDRDPDEVAHEADEIDAVVREFFWESLPRGNDPYEQEAWIDAWRSHYTDQAALVDGLKRKGWWPGKEREAQVASFSDV